MFDFIDAIFGFLEAIGTWIQGFFEMLFLALDALETLVTLPVFLIGVLPPILSTSLTLTLLVFLVKFILGR